jgi:hypothetical protein
MNLINKASISFLNAVVDPFHATTACKVPDTLQNESISIRDTIDTQQLVNDAGAPSWGALVWLSSGYSTASNALSSKPSSMYRMNVLPVDANGVAIEVSYSSFEFINEASIIGNDGTQTGWGPAQVTALRVVSMGLKALSAIETVTDTSVNYVTSFVGGQITENDIDTAIENQYDLHTVVQQGTNIKEYGNNEGCTVRYNPFQTNEQLDMLPMNTAISSTFNNDNILWPFIMFRCSQEVLGTDGETKNSDSEDSKSDFTFIKQTKEERIKERERKKKGSIPIDIKIPIKAMPGADPGPYPVYVWGRVWLEAELRKPTFIYSTPSPVDPEFDKLRSYMSTASGKVHPLTASGHSMKRFEQHLRAFMSHVKQQYRLGTSLFRMLETGKSNKPVRRFGKKVRKRARKIVRRGRRKVGRKVRKSANRIGRRFGKSVVVYKQARNT